MNTIRPLTPYPVLFRRYAGAIPLGGALYVALVCGRWLGGHLSLAMVSADWIGLVICVPVLMGLVVLADATWSEKGHTDQSVRSHR